MPHHPDPLPTVTCSSLSAPYGISLRGCHESKTVIYYGISRPTLFLVNNEYNNTDVTHGSLTFSWTECLTPPYPLFAITTPYTTRTPQPGPWTSSIVPPSVA